MGIPLLTTFISSKMSTKINLPDENITKEEIRLIHSKSTNKLIIIYLIIFVVAYLSSSTILNGIKLPNYLIIFYWIQLLTFITTIISFKGFKFKK